MSVVRATAAVARRPGLWVTALRVWRRTTPSGWWRRRPFLPVPDREYVRFRLQTQYGTADADVDPHDVLNYLVWCKAYDQRRQLR